MSKMRAMIVPEPGGRFRMEERDLPEPGRHEVRIRIHAASLRRTSAFHPKETFWSLKVKDRFGSA